MSIIKTSEKTTSYVLIIISITLFFLGFYLREISNGAAHTDFELHIWPLVNDFNENYFYTLSNYLDYNMVVYPKIMHIQWNRFLISILSNLLHNYSPRTKMAPSSSSTSRKPTVPALNTVARSMSQSTPQCATAQADSNTPIPRMRCTTESG